MKKYRTRRNPSLSTWIVLVAAGGAAWYFFFRHSEPPQLIVGAPRLQPRPLSTLGLLSTSVWDTTANQLGALGYPVVARDPVSLATQSRVFADQNGLAGSDHTRVEVVLAIDDAFRNRFGG